MTSNELTVADMREMAMFTPPPPRLPESDPELDNPEESKGPFPSIKIQRCEEDELCALLSDPHSGLVFIPDGLSKSRSIGSLPNTRSLSPIGSPSLLKRTKENKGLLSTNTSQANLSKSRSDGNINDSVSNMNRIPAIDLGTDASFPAPFEGRSTPRPPFVSPKGARALGASPKKPARLVPIEINKRQT
jgi:hypothetical protein